jgi:hypothetical protein
MPAPLGHPNYDTEGLAGRPKKYTEEFINKQADDLLEWMKIEGNIYFEKFLLDQSISPQRMTEWASVNKRFSEAYRIALLYQEYKLKDGATKKNYSEGFTKFMLINNHGYAEKTEAKISGDADNPLGFLLYTAEGKTQDLVENAKKIKH